MAEKIITKGLGEDLNTLGYRDFYKVFCKGIFRIALKDMLANIEELCSGNQKDLPLVLKLANYRRNLLLGGLDKGCKN